MPTAPQQSRESVEEGAGVRVVDVPLFGTDDVRPSDKPSTDFFIAPGYRPGQREALERIETAFERGARYVIVEAPTGIGKSHIARALAFKYGYTYIITIQKTLQSQYQRDFPEMFVMKGRSAYACQIDGHTCADGPCRAKRKRFHDDCPYSLALIDATRRPVLVHNFDSFYYQSIHANFGYRELMIIDEAHNIENKFLSFMEFTISNKQDRRMVIPEYRTMAEYDNFLEIRLREAEAELEVLEEANKPADVMIREMDALTSLIGRLEKYFQFKDKGVEYVFDYKEGKDYTTLTVRPVMVGDFVKTYLLSKSKRVLMMSATILDKGIFCASTGIRESECEFIRLGSVFPASNRPVYLRYAGSMNRHNIEDTLPKVVDMIQMILDKFPQSKGIIQTHTDKIMAYIRANIRDSRLTFRNDYYSVDDLLSVHQDKPASVLVASGLREGLDLKDELSRFQILCKVPYPDMGDKRIRRRMEIDRSWYSYMTSLMFVQMLGRSVRSETDKATTFMLDSDFGTFWSMGGKFFIPGYVKESLKW